MPMNLSKGNILCRNTWPRMWISSTRCTRRCVIIVKKDGGNTNSKLTRHWATSFCNLTRVVGLIDFCEIALRNAHSWTMDTRTFFGRSPRNATGSSWVISTWQSWDFRFWNFFSAIFIIPFIFVKLLTLDSWGAANLDKWWKKMGMNSSSGEETEEKNGGVSSRKNGDGARSGRWYMWGNI